ncbi:MAG: putative quinol monooxygenase [Chitinophagaceae bacterium]
MATSEIHVFARWKVKEGNKPDVLKLLKTLASKTLSEKGNLFYRINQSKTDASTLILFEGYTDESAQKAHVDSDHYKELAAKIIPLLDEREVFITTPLEE